MCYDMTKFAHLVDGILVERRWVTIIYSALAVIEDDSRRKQLANFYKKNKRVFYKIAFSNLHNKQDTEDAVQEAFMCIANNPELFFNISEEKRVSYVNVMIRNISYRIWNKNQETEENQTELSGDTVDKSASTEEIISSHYSCEEIYKFMDTLPEGEKAALYLKIHFDMKYSDIAKTLFISEEAAKKRVLRAAHKIKDFIEREENE